MRVVVNSPVASSYLETIFGEQMADWIVCLIVNMWNVLLLLSFCCFWQAAFHAKQKQTKKQKGEAVLNLELNVRVYTNMDLFGVARCTPICTSK